MKAAIRQRAQELGFAACHFTTAAPPASAWHFQQWLAQGRHGQMAYLERQARQRLDPQQVLASARSIITLGVSYAEQDLAHWQGASGRARELSNLPMANRNHPGSPMQKNWPSAMGNGQRGAVARYARYADYHEILGQGLKLLAEFVNQLGGPGTRSLGCVDTGPLLERDLAQRAGLGFIGKHTNLISRRLGNWIFLAEVITTLELGPDAPEQNHCGSCRRCLAACPTGALLAPFQLDARRCISYLTIELKGPIPVELRPALGHRIYGCDDCLAVCPWNRFACQGELLKARARPDLATPDLLELLALDEAGFQRRFAGTPLLRPRRRGLLRNVCVALGNTADQTALPALQQAAADPEPLIAEHARWSGEQVRARNRRVIERGADLKCAG